MLRTWRPGGGGALIFGPFCANTGPSAQTIKIPLNYDLATIVAALAGCCLWSRRLM